MYGDLIYLSNQAKICALQEREFGRVLQSEIWWFDALKSTFDVSSKCFWRTLMGRLGLIQQSQRDLVIWCFKEYLWFVFEVLLKNSYRAFKLDPTELRSLYTSSVDEGGLRTLWESFLAWRERESESFLACRACLEGNLYLPESSFL